MKEILHSKDVYDIKKDNFFLMVGEELFSYERIYKERSAVSQGYSCLRE